MIKRDFRYILKRVIIGFAVGMLLFLCKGKIAFAQAASFSNYRQCAIYHYKPCTIDNGNISCGLDITGQFTGDIEIEKGNGCSNSISNRVTGITPTSSVSFILSSIDYYLTTSNNSTIDYYYDYYFDLFPNNSGLTYNSYDWGGNDSVYGYYDLSYLLNTGMSGYHSILGGRVYSCQYTDSNNDIHDCLSNMSYYTTYSGGSNSYKYVPVFYSQAPNYSVSSMKTLHFSIGNNTNTFSSNYNDFIEHFTSIAPSPSDVILSPYPLAYYDYNVSRGGIYIPTDNNLTTYMSWTGNTNSYVAIPDIPDNPPENILTPEQEEIIDSVNDIFEQFTPDFWESIQSGSGITENIIGTATGDTSSILGGFVANDFATGFTGLFESIFQTPLDLFESQLSYDLWNGAVGNTNYNYCLGTHLSGSPLDPPTLRFWEYKTGNTYKYFSVDLPCMTDMYSKIVSPSGNYGFTTFYPIYRTIIDGILIYWVLVQVLQFYKYCIEPKDSSIEVLDL